jgi:hypothetical protein
VSPTDIARDTVGALKSSPALLMIVVLNTLMILGVGYVAKSQAEERREMRLRDDKIVEMLAAMCARGPK